MQYKLIVDKQSRLNPSTNRKIYILDIEELRTNGDISDELIISPNESYVMRRLSLSEYHVLTVLEEPIKEVIENPQIELFEGNNYIYLIDMTGNRFYAEYLIKNEFNDTFITKKEADAKIDVASQQVIISVNEKLTSYSTTEETSAIIKALSDAITLELKKKINDKDLTGASITLRLNEDTSEAKINADKIELTANDILNIIAGAILNLTANNMTISSNNFSVNKNGDVTCSNMQITGGSIELQDNNANSAYSKFKISNSEGTKYLLEKPFLLNIENEKDGNYLRNEVTNGASHVYLKCGSKKVETQATTSEASIWLTDGNKNTTISQNGITTPTVTQTSLKSKKKNIKKLKINALDLVKNADICEYNFKGEKKGTKKHIGLVIGEGYNCPEQVISEDRQGVEPYSLTSLLWKSVQELTAKVEQLEVANGKN